MRKLIILVIMVFAVGLTASAQSNSRGDLFVGYSYIHVSPQTSGAPSFAFNGGSLSASYRFGWVSLVGDLGGYHVGTISGVNVDTNLVTYLVGPRHSFARGDRYNFFAQALFGGARLNTSSFLPGGASRNVFAMTAGGGLDTFFTPHFGVRAQAEYMMTRFQEVPAQTNRQNSIRISGGLVVRF
jgi:opacity protein-like surface antigen